MVVPNPLKISATVRTTHLKATMKSDIVAERRPNRKMQPPDPQTTSCPNRNRTTKTATPTHKQCGALKPAGQPGAHATPQICLPASALLNVMELQIAEVRAYSMSPRAFQGQGHMRFAPGSAYNTPNYGQSAPENLCNPMGLENCTNWEQSLHPTPSRNKCPQGGPTLSGSLHQEFRLQEKLSGVHTAKPTGRLPCSGHSTDTQWTLNGHYNGHSMDTNKN